MLVFDFYRSAGIGQHAEVRVLIRLAEEVIQLVFHVERHVVVIHHRDDGQLKWRTYFKLAHDVIRIRPILKAFAVGLKLYDLSLARKCNIDRRLLTTRTTMSRSLESELK